MEIKSFILRKTENLDKLSCHSYDPEILQLLNKLKEKGVSLSDIKEEILSGPMGFQLHTYDYVPESYKNKVKLLQISNISKLGNIINTKRDKFISEEKDEELKKCRVKRGDLIISKTGELGRIAIFNNDYKANLNQALGIIRLKQDYNGIKINPQFIHLYLNSFYANAQLKYYGGFRAGQSGLSLDEIGYVYIILPNEDKQKEILEKVDKIREEAVEHYRKYKDYSEKAMNKPLEIFGIKIPSENENTFVFNKELNGRIDAINNSPFLEKLRENIKNYGYKEFSFFMKSAKNEFIYSNFYNLIDLDNIDENTGIIKDWIEVGQLNSTKTTLKTDNILISKLGGEKGNIILIEKEFNNFLGSGELVDFELKDEFDKEYLYYLFYLLRSPYISKQIEYTLSGCSRMRINSGDMEKLLIPFNENKSVIEKVIKECSDLRDKAIMEKEQYKLKMEEIFNKFSELLPIK